MPVRNPAGATSTPLRRQLLVTIVGITSIAVLVLVLLLAVAVQRLYHSEAITKLERDATRVAATAPDDEAHNPRPFNKPAGLNERLVVGIYRVDGSRIVGDGPDVSPLASEAANGRLHESVEGGTLTVVAPIPSEVGVTSIARVGMPQDEVYDRRNRAWLLMAVFAVVVIGLAAAAAFYQSRRLARPLERLTRAAQSLGDGDFTVRAEPSGVREADEAGRALEVTARHLGSMLDRERAFSADVSHQLRTPLTGLLLGLESALERPGADLTAAIRAAVRRGEHLRDIIDDLLRLARDAGPDAEVLDVPDLLGDLRSRWSATLTGVDRPLSVTAHDPLPELHVKSSAVRQILDVLIDNAVTHGGGRITVEASDIGGGLAIDVSDQGPGVTDDTEDIFARRNSASAEGHGIGLALARSLAEAEGGRLVLRRPSPPIFTLLLPAAEPLPRTDQLHP
ncbi:HAMP domain-containing sensor histidine kinase [Spirillospora sp. NPDC052269]